MHNVVQPSAESDQGKVLEGPQLPASSDVSLALFSSVLCCT